MKDLRPWLDIDARAGTRQYAQEICDWLNLAFTESYKVACVNGWWFAEEFTPFKLNAAEEKAIEEAG